MKKFKSIDELHAYLERRASATIKHYYTDWKNYDRPEVMRHTGEKTSDVYIIFRECGSYIFSKDELTDMERDFPAVVMDYYTTDKTALYYKVDFCKLTAEKIPAGLPDEIRRHRTEKEHEQRMSA